MNDDDLRIQPQEISPFGTNEKMLTTWNQRRDVLNGDISALSQGTIVSILEAMQAYLILRVCITTVVFSNVSSVWRGTAATGKWHDKPFWSLGAIKRPVFWAVFFYSLSVYWLSFIV